MLHYYSLGNGNKIFILHGLFGMADFWMPLATNLKNLNYNIIIPDLPNHGLSFHINNYKLEKLSKIIIDFINSFLINNEKITIIGHSLGGKIAISIAANIPTIIDKLIIIDIVNKKYTVPTEINNIINVIKNINICSINNRAQLLQIINSYNIDNTSKQIILKNVKIENNNLAWKFNPNMINNINDLLLPVFLPNIIYTPTLFLKAENSNFIKLPYDKIKTTKYIPNSKFVIIKNSSHNIHLDNFNDLYTNILNFIQN